MRMQAVEEEAQEILVQLKDKLHARLQSVEVPPAEVSSCVLPVSATHM